MKVKGGVSFSVLPKYNSVFRLRKLSTFLDMADPKNFFFGYSNYFNVNV